ncbi:hypothetical protein DIPPA_30960 [Diplonema papillatum]|nr:hypothetical protein DIPPA_30960 [Diplonema papillatum]
MRTVAVRASRASSGTRCPVTFCQILDGFVRRKYWSGDTLKPTEPDLPPFLTFFGSGQFGHAVPAEFKSSAP